MPINIGDRVDRVDGARLNGVVLSKACHAATKAGGGTCNRSTCAHPNQDYVWVDWQGKTTSCHQNELQLALPQQATTSAIDNAIKNEVAGEPDPLADGDLKELAEKAGEIIEDRLKIGTDPTKVKDFFKHYNYGNAHSKYDLEKGS